MAQTSTICGPDVHDPKGSRESFVQKRFALIFWSLCESTANAIFVARRAQEHAERSGTRFRSGTQFPMLALDHKRASDSIPKRSLREALHKYRIPLQLTMLILVTFYRAIRLRFGYGFESCDANSPRNVKNTNPAKQRPRFFPTSPCVRNRCDSCDNETGRFVCPRCTRETDGIAAKLLQCGIASEVPQRNMPLRCSWKQSMQHLCLKCARTWEPVRNRPKTPESGKDAPSPLYCSRQPSAPSLSTPWRR